MGCFRLLLTLSVFALLLDASFGIDCYTCFGKDWNSEECTRSVARCNQQVDNMQDTCATIVSWKPPDYATPMNARRYYIYKGCQVSSDCEALKMQMADKCNPAWGNDWTCVECCTGDRCNYNINYYNE